MGPILAHGFQGPAGGVSSTLYLVAAVAAFVFLEARDRRRTAENPAALNRRVRISATVCVLAMLLGVSALWWVPGARKHDKPTATPAPAQFTAARDHANPHANPLATLLPLPLNPPKPVIHGT